MSDEIIRPIPERTKREPLLRERLRANPLPFLVTDDLTKTQKQQICVPDLTWFIPNKLAALACPQAADVFTALQEIGVSALLNLSETPLPANIIEKVGLRAEHIPIVGFRAPGVRQIKQALTIIDACLEHSIPVGIVGIRHASVILACYLVEQGMSAHTAFDIIRKWRPDSLVYTIQQAAVFRYEAALT